MQQKDSFTDTLRQAFLDGIIKGGQPLTEEALSKTYGVSRTPVREALIRLESEGLVTIIKNKGAFVREITPTDVVEVFQLRILLEGYGARMCVDYIDMEQLRVLYDELKSLEKTEGLEEIKNKLGHKLHKMITNVTPNERFRSVVNGLYAQFVRARDLARFIPGSHVRSMRHHLKIAEQILAHNGPGAEKAMKQHLQSTMNDIVSPANMQVFFMANHRP
jgi:DNA-binding GntR family transcriptional regulator